MNVGSYLQGRAQDLSCGENQVAGENLVSAPPALFSAFFERFFGMLYAVVDLLDGRKVWR